MNKELTSTLNTKDVNSVRSYLESYYGQKLKTNQDLTQKACCTGKTLERYSSILELIPEPVKQRYYGCGCPVPDDNLEGLTVLDLGCGSGQDVFILSKLVGPSGFVFGIDMTQDQLDVATANAGEVIDRYGFRQSNVRFIRDFIESAESIQNRSIDLVISNCVINLSPRKDLVFETIARVLKEGGELYISDIVSDRRVPDEIREDPQMIGECLGGAEYEHDWIDQMKDAGFLDPRIVSRTEVQNEANGIPIAFYSMTVRAFYFKNPLDRRCENYGQIATYLGNIAQQRARFMLDDHHLFEADRPTPVCRNTARMLSETRFANHFTVTPPVRHFGLFPCAPSIEQNTRTNPAGCC